MEAKRGKTNFERKVALWALRQYGDYTFREMSEKIGIGTKTVGWACSQVSKELSRNNSPLQKRLKRINKAISQQRT
ncbi:MAG: hypothetical protein Q7S00_00350, partial [bacterium]|nr:hypothetical protein [bacterium]